MNLTVDKIMATPVVTTTLGSTTGYVRELMERKQAELAQRLANIAGLCWEGLGGGG